jgi:hypothetical protein
MADCGCASLNGLPDGIVVVPPGATILTDVFGNQYYVLPGGQVIFYRSTPVSPTPESDCCPVIGTTNRIVVTSPVTDTFQVDIASTYIGQTSINTLGTINSGTWNATIIDPLYGGSGYISKTYAQMATLVAGSSLISGASYFISDRNIFIRTTSSNTLENKGILKATNVDFQNVSTNFIGVWKGMFTIFYTGLVGSFNNSEDITGGTSGATGHILRKNGVAGTIIAISKNGINFIAGEVVTGGTSGATATIGTISISSILGTIALNKIVAWNNNHYVNITGSGTIQHPVYDTTNWTLLAKTDSSYQIEYDPIIYDFTNDKLVERKDKRGNYVSNLINTTYATDNFQWGRDTGFNNTILGPLAYECANTIVAQNGLFIQDSNVIIDESGNLTGSIVTNRSDVRLTNTVDARSCRVDHASMYTYGNSRALEATLALFSTVIATDTADVGTAIYNNATITATGTTTLLGCQIDGRQSLVTATFASENHSGEMYIRGVYSNFGKALTITNVTATLTLDSSLIYGRYIVTTTGGAGNITAITNFPSHPVNIGIATNNLQFTHNAASLKIKGGTNITLINVNGDFIEFTNVGGIIKEYNAGQY